MNYIKEKKIWIIGALIIICSTIINLVPNILITRDPFWMISISISSEWLYYFLSVLAVLPIGVILAAIVGNKTTGFLTYVVSGIYFILKDNIAYVMISFILAIICMFIYDNKKLPKALRYILAIILSTATVVGVIFLEKVLAFIKSAILMTSVCAVVIITIVIIVASLLEKIPVFTKFDEETKDLDHNYRVHSIERKLMIVINAICIILVALFSVLAIFFLTQKEKEKTGAQNSIWQAMLRKPIEEDAEAFYENDIETIKNEAIKFQEVFQDAYISVPAYITIMTRLEDCYLRQVYEVTMGDIYTYDYAVEWQGENEVALEAMEGMYFLPDIGDSAIYVVVGNNLRESIIEAIKQIVSAALLLIVFMNILVEAFIRKIIVRPINQMTTEAVRFAFGIDELDKLSAKERNEILNRDRIVIHSGDEIESLNNAIHKTMDDIENYIERVREKSKQISDMQHNIIITMADIIESRDLNTGGHIKRTAVYVGIIARKLMEENQFSDILTQDYLENMIVAAPLHDMGKIHVPDHILNKNGRLTDEEFAIMKTHASVGKELLDVASESLGEFHYLIIAKQMAEGHHEWWNGNGYPEKVAGDEIPLCARIMAVADVFDALVSKRCYKDPMDLDVAFGIIEKETGTHFDPIVGKAFLDSRNEVETVLKELTEE